MEELQLPHLEDLPRSLITQIERSKRIYWTLFTVFVLSIGTLLVGSTLLIYNTGKHNPINPHNIIVLLTGIIFGTMSGAFFWIECKCRKFKQAQRRRWARVEDARWKRFLKQKLEESKRLTGSKNRFRGNLSPETGPSGNESQYIQAGEIQDIDIFPSRGRSRIPKFVTSSTIRPPPTYKPKHIRIQLPSPVPREDTEHHGSGLIEPNQELAGNIASNLNSSPLQLQTRNEEDEKASNYELLGRRMASSVEIEEKESKKSGIDNSPKPPYKFSGPAMRLPTGMPKWPSHLSPLQSPPDSKGKHLTLANLGKDLVKDQDTPKSEGGLEYANTLTSETKEQVSRQGSFNSSLLVGTSQSRPNVPRSRYPSTALSPVQPALIEDQVTHDFLPRLSSSFKDSRSLDRQKFQTLLEQFCKSMSLPADQLSERQFQELSDRTFGKLQQLLSTPSANRPGSREEWRESGNDMTAGVQTSGSRQIRYTMRPEDPMSVHPILRDQRKEGDRSKVLGRDLGKLDASKMTPENSNEIYNPLPTPSIHVSPPSPVANARPSIRRTQTLSMSSTNGLYRRASDGDLNHPSATSHTGSFRRRSFEIQAASVEMNTRSPSHSSLELARENSSMQQLYAHEISKGKTNNEIETSLDLLQQGDGIKSKRTAVSNNRPPAQEPAQLQVTGSRPVAPLYNIRNDLLNPPDQVPSESFQTNRESPKLAPSGLDIPGNFDTHSSEARVQSFSEKQQEESEWIPGAVRPRTSSPSPQVPHRISPRALTFQNLRRLSLQDTGSSSTDAKSDICASNIELPIKQEHAQPEDGFVRSPSAHTTSDFPRTKQHEGLIPRPQQNHSVPEQANEPHSNNDKMHPRLDNDRASMSDSSIEVLPQIVDDTEGTSGSRGKRNSRFIKFDGFGFDVKNEFSRLVGNLKGLARSRPTNRWSRF